MRRTTVVLDEQLLEEARRVLGTEGVRETLEGCLLEVVKRARREALIASLGKLDLDLTPEILDTMRHGE